MACSFFACTLDGAAAGVVVVVLVVVAGVMPAAVGDDVLFVSVDDEDEAVVDVGAAATALEAKKSLSLSYLVSVVETVGL